MLKKYLSLAVSMVIALGMTSCSKGAESSDSKADSNLLAENAEEKERYLFLPDGVSLDEEHQYDPEEGVWSDYKKGIIKYTEIFPDEEGYISYDPMGVRFALPEKCRAYLFPFTGVGDYENFIIITDEWFPDVKNYIMISTGTSCTMEVRRYDDDVKSFYPEVSQYRSAVKSHFEQWLPILKEGEGIYIYDYFNISDNNVINMDANDDENALAVMKKSGGNSSISLIGGSYGSERRGYAPDSEMSEIESEIIEDGNRFDVKLSYSVKRYGADMEKNVHWLAEAPIDDTKSTMAKRVEFSYDTKTDMRFDEEGFLSEVSAYVPENWSGEDLFYNNYFVPDNILGELSPITIEYNKKNELENRWTQ